MKQNLPEALDLKSRGANNAKTNATYKTTGAQKKNCKVVLMRVVFYNSAFRKES